MNQEDQVTSGDAQSSSGTDESQSQSNAEVSQDKVDYGTFKKVLGEKKKTQEELKAMKEKLTKLEQADLESKGKQSELIESLRKQLQEKDQQFEKVKHNFAFNLYSKAVKSELEKTGAIDPDLMLSQIDVNSIQMNDDFTFNEDDIKREVANLSTKKPKLFQKKIVDVKDGVPKSSVNGSGGLDLSKMKLADKMKLLSEMTTKGAFNKR